MAIIKPTIITPENEHRFQNFILFEPASSRITDIDVLVRGEAVLEMYETIIDKLSDDDSLKAQIMRNKLSKVGQMLDLLSAYENVVISKFFDRVWRRYSYISNIGEAFLPLNLFVTYFPEYKNEKENILAQRLDEEDEDMDPQDSVESVDAVSEPVQA